MICPRCGSDVPAATDWCSRCAAPLGQTVATGVLTPPPAANPDDVRTSFAAAPFGQNEATGVPTPSPVSSPDDVGTAFAPRLDVPPDLDGMSETGVDLATRVVASRKAGAQEAATSALGATVSTRHASLLEPGQAFGSRYHIIRSLGVGGMGAVYQAWDAELGVAVAMKVIRPDVMADPGASAEVERRFKRELLLARKVTHKNVVRIHDLGEIGGIKYITMTYVDGADLSSLLKREGTLLVPTVLRIARAVVSGLVEAHKAGVVHRDLKPANIMIAKTGDALIMDFGIARLAGAARETAAADAPEAARLPAGVRHTSVTAEATRYGSVMGTVEYMAPEQARGEDVDQRADIYALGLMLYDMLVGRKRRAERTESAIAELKARMVQPPPPLKSLVPDMPDAIDRMVSRCIEPNPENRYQTTEDLAAELDRLDENGVPIPEVRRFTPRMIAAAVLLVTLLVTGTWWLTRTPPLPKQHDPVVVLIADFKNQTGDSSFDGTLEPMLRRALEGAGFISAFDRNGIRAAFGVTPPPRLDDVAARELAIKQGVGVVVSGVLERQGSGYVVSAKAVESVTGKQITATNTRAAAKEQVLAAATQLMPTIRTALGDETSDSDQLFAMTSVSATSLHVVRYYAASREAAANGKFEESLQNALKAVELDSKLGIGYQLAAVASNNLRNAQDAEKYINDAIRYLDSMTERERYATRGFRYRLAGDYQGCVKEYGDLIARYAADVSAHNQLALCSTYLRDMKTAVEVMRRAVAILPNRVLYRGNLALYLNYAGDFPAGEKEGRAVRQPELNPLQAVAFAQIAGGRVGEAAATYQQLSTVSTLAASYAASGVADLAIYEGRLSEAVRLLEEGAAADLAAKSAERAATKFASVAYVQTLRGQKAAAVAAADKALANGKAARIRFITARALIEVGESAKAQPLIASLASERFAEPKAYAKILEGLAALKAGKSGDAINAITEGNKLLDTWIGHFDLGRALFAAGDYLQADSEFDRCLKRRGEALSLFLDEWATYGYLPPVYYYQGRVREELKTERFRDSYRQYLEIRGQSTEDPLLPEVRRRAGA